MASFTRASFSEKWGRIRRELTHAFSTTAEDQVLSLDDLHMLERVADAVVKRDMAAPATLFLESLGPMNFLGSQALHFLTPLLEFAFDVKDLEQVARLLERRDTIARLISLIEQKSSLRAPQGASPR